MLTLVCLFSCKEVRPKNTTTQEIQAPPPPAAVLGAPEIRVAVLRDAREVRIGCAHSSLTLSDGRGQEISKLPAGSELYVKLENNTLTVNGRVVPSTGLRAVADGRVTVNGAELARQLDVYLDATRPGTLTAVAYIGLEEYLVGVLAGEVPYDRWGAEALKAQAITSRSYALYQMKVHAGDPYDVESTVMSQVFKPGNHNNVVLNAAVNGTRGLVLTSGGKLFPAYFHSTCGGATARGPGVFPDSPAVATLNGRACPYCTQSPSYRWHAEIAREEIARKLRAFPDLAGKNIGTIQSLEFQGGSSAAPRADLVRIQHSGGTLTMNANRFRIAVGAGLLKSVMVERVAAKGDLLVFDGRGFGHGVGLCQYGSNGMAERGYTCEQILGFYYAGGELTKVYGDRLTASR
ncbi:MAG: SpoIID/LytB domain-containing protein [Planctomycetota bacterium]|nr:SpoIID/LytB domain-containing protein [Planctomycetota bacterium]